MIAMETDLATAVATHADRPDVRAAVTGLYDRLAIEITARRPRCDALGECCRFDAYGHRLYVTTIELITFAAQLPAIRPSSSKQRLNVLQPSSGGACVFQIDGLCGVHSIRPFGCRMFYCDPMATDWQQNTYERFHTELKALHEQLGVPYMYVEWRAALRAIGLTEPGRAGP